MGPAGVYLVFSRKSCWMGGTMLLPSEGDSKGQVDGVENTGPFSVLTWSRLLLDHTALCSSAKCLPLGREVWISRS